MDDMRGFISLSKNLTEGKKCLPVDFLQGVFGTFVNLGLERKSRVNNYLMCSLILHKNTNFLHLQTITGYVLHYDGQKNVSIEVGD